MNKTAVEWLASNLDIIWEEKIIDLVEAAKKMERNERLKRQLFIGKVTEIIGFDKVVELWKECDEVFKSEQQ
jgi:hypothetical protein